MADNDLFTGYVMGQSEGNSNGSMFGGDGLWGLIIILALLNGGFGFGGGGGGGMLPFMMGGNLATQADVRAAVDQQTLISKLDQQTYGLADSTYALNNTIINGFHGVDNAICTLGYNTQQGFNFRGIDQVMNALQNILPEVGVFYLPEVLESSREVRDTKNGGKNTFTTLKVKYTFYAADGSHVSATVQSEGMDSADKSSNKAMSGACKYALFQAFNIATEEMIDPDADDPHAQQTQQARPAAQQQAQQVQQTPAAQQQEAEFDEKAFLRNFGGVKEYCTPFSPANAVKVEDSEGRPYGTISTKDLRFRLNAIISSLRKNGLTEEQKQDKQFKLGVINAILLDRKAKLEQGA